MNGALFEDTIAAIATPPGRGALALVRASGPSALQVLTRLCPEAASLEHWPARSQRLLHVRHPDSGVLVDRALVTYFRGPASYTGEDSFEIASHGGDVTPALVLAAAQAAGARLALPGEFTRRAVLNGKIDLLQAEAVADVIDARSPAFQSAALHQMERGLSARLETLREDILRAEALVAYGIDFPDEDEPPVPDAAILEQATRVGSALELLLATAPEGEMLRRGALVVLAGLPNSGKSSLFNALIGSERAIVTEVPGTTRDAVEAELTIDGHPFRLVDTAGLRDTTDRVESIGIEVARRYLAGADLVLYCSDAGGQIDEREREFVASLDRPALLLRTRADLYPPAEAPAGWTTLSVRSGEGVARVREWLLERAFGRKWLAGEAPVITSERHVRALAAARDEILRFSEAFDGGVPPEVAATHLRTAATLLEELIGVVSPDDVVGAIFARFCVGK